MNSKNHHHRHLMVHFLPRLIKGMNGCFPTGQRMLNIIRSHTHSETIQSILDRVFRRYRRQPWKNLEYNEPGKEDCRPPYEENNYTSHHQFIILYYENVAFFHAKLEWYVCPRVDNQTSGDTLHDLTRSLSTITITTGLLVYVTY